MSNKDEQDSEDEFLHKHVQEQDHFISSDHELTSKSVSPNFDDAYHMKSFDIDDVNNSLAPPITKTPKLKKEKTVQFVF